MTVECIGLNWLYKHVSLIGCHDLLMMSRNLDDIAALNIQGIDYCCMIKGISKSEAVNLLQNANSNKKTRILWK